MEKMSPEKVKEILLKQGRKVTTQEARLILEMLQKLAKMIVSNYQNERK